MSNPIILVGGPWSSGSSAVTGFIAKLGIPAPGPYVQCNDPKTPLTYELEEFQKFIVRLAPDTALRTVESSHTIVKLLTQFRDEVLPDILLKLNIPKGVPVLLKHPSVAFMLDEFFQVFPNTRMLVVMRPFKAIEATRLRRQWHASYGVMGAQMIYGKLFAHIVNTSTPYLLTRYADLLTNPERFIQEVSGFLEISPTEQQIQEACDYIHKRPS